MVTLPHCPDCSIITTGYREGPIFWRLRTTERWTLLACCPLSRGAPVMEKGTSEEEAQAVLKSWWEEKRKSATKRWVLEALDQETQKLSS